jgi:hypothetical protein
MAGLVPAIHVFFLLKFSKDVDARDKPGHDDFLGLLAFDSDSHEFRRLALVAIAAAAVRFSTPSLA